MLFSFENLQDFAAWLRIQEADAKKRSNYAEKLRDVNYETGASHAYRSLAEMIEKGQIVIGDEEPDIIAEMYDFARHNNKDATITYFPLNREATNWMIDKYQVHDKIDTSSHGDVMIEASIKQAGFSILLPR